MANETSTPAVVNAADLVKADLEKTKVDLEEQRKEAASKISELSRTNATLQQRMQEIENKKDIEQKIKVTQINQDRISSLLEKAKVDPNGAGVELNNIIEQQRNEVVADLAPKMKQAIDTAVYVELLKRDNPDLVPYEEEMLASIQLKMGKNRDLSFRQALDETVAKFKGLTHKTTSPATTVIPNGARGEGGSNLPPPPPAQADDEPIDANEIARREIALRNAKLNGRARAVGTN